MSNNLVHLHEFLEPGAKLPRTVEATLALLARTGPLALSPPARISSLIVVLLLPPLLETAATRGLKTLLTPLQSGACMLPILLDCPEVKIELSVGGLPDDAVGLRRRCTRDALWLPPPDPEPMDDLRLRADRICFFSSASRVGLLSAAFLLGPSSSEEEAALPFSGVTSDEAFETTCNDERYGTLLGSISRSGECSESDEKPSIDEFGIEPSGEPSFALFDRNPAWNRLLRGFISKETSGRVGSGEELSRSVGMEKIGAGGGGSIEDDISGVE